MFVCSRIVEPLHHGARKAVADLSKSPPPRQVTPVPAHFCPRARSAGQDSLGPATPGQTWKCELAPRGTKVNNAHPEGYKLATAVKGSHGAEMRVRVWADASGHCGVQTGHAPPAAWTRGAGGACLRGSGGF